MDSELLCKMLNKLVRYFWIFLLIYILTYGIYIFNNQLSLVNNHNVGDISEDIKKLQLLNTSLYILNNELKVLHSKVHNINIDDEITLVSKEIIDTVEPIKSNRNFKDIDKTNIKESKHEKEITVNNKTKNKIKNVLIFTMDSISSYEIDSKKGGAAGEIIIRKSLENCLKYYNINVITIKSDIEFEKCNIINYDIIILDPWTWAGKGWIPKKNIQGYDNKIYILDFFGSKGLRNNGLNIPLNRFLTAFGSPWNTFLGYYIDNYQNYVVSSNNSKVINQGIIWGKDNKHFNNKENIIKYIINNNNNIQLISTISKPLINNNRIKWLGHQTTQQWLELLSKSKFLLGLGNPLLGPSAIDAISLGCMYINPIYDTPVMNGYTSQHPYAQDKIGLPYVCSYHENNMNELMLCINKALTSNLKPYIPNDFIKENYYQRVKDIFTL